MTIASQLCDTAEMPKAETMEPMPDIDLGKLCRDLRAQLGLSKNEMATILGVSYGAYDHYEHDRREPTAQAVAKMNELIKRLALPPVEAVNKK